MSCFSWGCSVTVAQISPKDLDWVQLLAPLPQRTLAIASVFCYAYSDVVAECLGVYPQGGIGRFKSCPHLQNHDTTRIY